MDTKWKIGTLLTIVGLSFVAWQLYRSEQGRPDVEATKVCAGSESFPHLKARAEAAAVRAREDATGKEGAFDTKSSEWEASWEKLLHSMDEKAAGDARYLVNQRPRDTYTRSHERENDVFREAATGLLSSELPSHYCEVTLMNTGQVKLDSVRLAVPAGAYYSLLQDSDWVPNLERTKGPLEFGSLLPGGRVQVRLWGSAYNFGHDLHYHHTTGHGPVQEKTEDWTAVTWFVVWLGTFASFLALVVAYAVGRTQGERGLSEAERSLDKWQKYGTQAKEQIDRLEAELAAHEKRVSGHAALNPIDVLLVDIVPTDRSLVRLLGKEWTLDFEVRFVNRGPFEVTLRRLAFDWDVCFLDPDNLGMGERAARGSDTVSKEFKPIPPGMLVTYPVKIRNAQLGEKRSHTARLGIRCEYAAVSEVWGELAREGDATAARHSAVQVLPVSS